MKIDLETIIDKDQFLADFEDAIEDLYRSNREEGLYFIPAIYTTKLYNTNQYQRGA